MPDTNQFLARWSASIDLRRTLWQTMKLFAKRVDGHWVVGGDGQLYLVSESPVVMWQPPRRPAPLLLYA